MIWLLGNTVDEIIDAIKTMKVRGAPAIGAAGAFGMLLAAKSYSSSDVYIIT